MGSLNSFMVFRGKSIVFRVYKVSVSTNVLIGTFFVSIGFYLHGRFEINTFFNAGSPCKKGEFSC